MICLYGLKSYELNNTRDFQAKGFPDVGRKIIVKKEAAVSRLARNFFISLS